MDRWKGRVALVTGASAGIGAQLCQVLAGKGMRVVGCAREATRIPTVAVNEAGGSIIGIKCDLTREEDILSLFSEIRRRLGRVDVCVNNAGLSHDAPLLSTHEHATQQWRNMIDVNIVGLCICTREAVRLMRENNIDDGQIIHINSMSGHRMPGGTLYMYTATKCMLKSLAEGHRKELRADGSNIRVASVSPGLVETEFAPRCYRDNPEKARQLYGSIHSLQPDDIAESVLYILGTPTHVDVTDILVRPTEQAS